MITLDNWSLMILILTINFLSPLVNFIAKWLWKAIFELAG